MPRTCGKGADKDRGTGSIEELVEDDEAVAVAGVWQQGGRGVQEVGGVLPHSCHLRPHTILFQSISIFFFFFIYLFTFFFSFFHSFSFSSFLSFSSFPCFLPHHSVASEFAIGTRRGFPGEENGGRRQGQHLFNPHSFWACGVSESLLPLKLVKHHTTQQQHKQ